MTHCSVYGKSAQKDASDLSTATHFQTGDAGSVVGLEYFKCHLITLNSIDTTESLFS